jgi:phage gpG-like protein
MAKAGGGARISIVVDGKADFDRVFSRLDANFDDLSPIWPDVRDEFWQIEKEQFDSEGSAGGSGRWKQLSKRYGRSRKSPVYGAGKKILEASGELRESLTGQTANTRYYTTPKEIAVGTSLPYGIYHQRGRR